MSWFSCERVGTISFVYNRVYWEIHNFLDLKESYLQSSPFHLLSNYWKFEIRHNGSISSSKRCMEVRVKRIAKNEILKGYRIRLGIAGSNLEIAKTFEAEDKLSYSPMVLSSDSERQRCEWVHGGTLRLFLAIEKPEGDVKEDSFDKVNGKMGNGDSVKVDKNAVMDAVAQTEEQPGNGDSIKVDKNTVVDALAQTEEQAGNENSVKIEKNTLVDAFAQTEEQPGISKLSQDLKEILLSKNFSDLFLKVDDKEFRAHRCILAARSPVFSAMMMHETKEKNTGIVNILDIDPDTLSDFLNYLYTGSKEYITSQNAVKLYTAADKYQVNELKEACVGYMLKNITADNFCDVLTLSLRHVEENLTNACSQFFNENSLSVVLTSKWQTFLAENPVVGNELYIKQLRMNK